MSETSAKDLIARIAQCSHAMSIQSGEPGIELAGHTLSFLAAHPEHIERYMSEGNELWIDGTITFDGGCLSYRTIGGDIHSADFGRRLRDRVQ